MNRAQHRESNGPPVELSALALQSYRDEFKELSETWRQLDAKAQGLSTIAGVFLAAIFAWIREIPVTFGPFQRIVVFAIVILLISVVGASIRALQIRRVSSPPLGDDTAELITDIENLINDADYKDRIVGFNNDQSLLWRRANDDVRTKISDKADAISLGQIGLLIVAILTVLVVARPILMQGA